MTEVEEAAPLAKPEVEPRDHSGTKAGAGLVFFVAFAVFVAARLSAKWVIPRGKRYEVTTVLGPKVELIAASPRTGQHHQEDGLQSLSQLQLADEIPADTNQDNDNEASSMALGTWFTYIRFTYALCPAAVHPVHGIRIFYGTFARNNLQ